MSCLLFYVFVDFLTRFCGLGVTPFPDQNSMQKCVHELLRRPWSSYGDPVHAQIHFGELTPTKISMHNVKQSWAEHYCQPSPPHPLALHQTPTSPSPPRMRFHITLASNSADVFQVSNEGNLGFDLLELWGFVRENEAYSASRFRSYLTIVWRSPNNHLTIV